MNDYLGKLLLDERPLVIQRTLVKVLGSLDEAVFVQQLHYWLMLYKDDVPHQRDGRVWIWNSYEAWVTQFGIWTYPTLRRIVKSLEDRGVIITTMNYNLSQSDKTKWYTIDYAKLEELLKGAPKSDTNTLLHPSQEGIKNDKVGSPANSGINSTPSQITNNGLDGVTSSAGIKRSEPDLDQYMLEYWGRAWSMMGWGMKKEFLQHTRNADGSRNEEKVQQLRDAVRIAAKAGETGKTVRFVEGILRKCDEKKKSEVARYVNTPSQSGSTKTWKSYCGVVIPASDEWNHKQGCSTCKSESERMIEEIARMALSEMKGSR